MKTIAKRDLEIAFVLETTAFTGFSNRLCDETDLVAVNQRYGYKTGMSKRLERSRSTPILAAWGKT
jgi:hypothetical protein